MSFAAVDLASWVRDYGALVAALIAVFVGLYNAWLGVEGARRSKREEWAREVRLPVYVALARAVDELETEATLRWEREVGVTKGFENQRSVDDCIRDMWRHLADVELVGPPEVVPARAVQLGDAVLAYRSGTERDSGATEDQSNAYQKAFTAFRKAARVAIDLPA